ncbi:hypothetical protein CPB83DRAFT_860724 [Crepidotus variabilis]|uniref:DUF6533 domain-containing protein n=1 Tax=Crepidotus variabilis TaxID=179855 RepID=A0A9P6JL33_9AGAR|nr:hypothetical protein CPB83DRAFT_860724 [Crepidotus variabilis]
MLLESEIVPISQQAFEKLYEGNIVPLRVTLAGLTWVLHDYFVTLEDEIRFFWFRKRSTGTFLFLWIRYYTIFLILFDTIQIHLFVHPAIHTNAACVAMAPTSRILGAIGLWSVEIIMQVRLYALFNRSKKVAVFNGVLFVASMGVFLWILVLNSKRRGQMIASAIHLPLPGCPTINGGTEWALWLSPMAYEFILFFFLIYKGYHSVAVKMRLNHRMSLMSILLQQNAVYFLSVGGLLLFNNLMVISATKIPWLGWGLVITILFLIQFSNHWYSLLASFDRPFHSALGIVTGRMLLGLRQFTEQNIFEDSNVSMSTINIAAKPSVPIRFADMKLPSSSGGSQLESSMIKHWNFPLTLSLKLTDECSLSNKN